MRRWDAIKIESPLVPAVRLLPVDSVFAAAGPSTALRAHTPDPATYERGPEHLLGQCLSWTTWKLYSIQSGPWQGSTRAASKGSVEHLKELLALRARSSAVDEDKEAHTASLDEGMPPWLLSKLLSISTSRQKRVTSPISCNHIYIAGTASSSTVVVDIVVSPQDSAAPSTSSSLTLSRSLRSCTPMLDTSIRKAPTPSERSSTVQASSMSPPSEP